LLVALETAHLHSDSLLSCHDQYYSLANAVQSDDARLALGHGIAVFFREPLTVCRLLTPANTDRLLIARVTSSPTYSFILIGFHTDTHQIKDSLALLEHTLRMINVRYPEADVVVFSDLNSEFGSAASRNFFASL
jgi:hypothetical protein